MVVALGPGKFYGSSLPRPRIYTDIKLSDERVDPPVPVLDPLLSWAEEAHWSMGGLSFKRLRLQGRIEGNVNKLRKEKEKMLRKQRKDQSSTPVFKSKGKLSIAARNGGGKKVGRVDSPPPAPISKKPRLRSMLMEEDDEDDEFEGEEAEKRGENGGLKRKSRRLVRKLGDDFEMVASEIGKGSGAVSGGVASRTRSRRSMVLPEEEEEFDNGGNLGSEKKAEKINGERGLVSLKGARKKTGENGSVSPPNGTRSSPRMKHK